MAVSARIYGICHVICSYTSAISRQIIRKTLIKYGDQIVGLVYVLTLKKNGMIN